MRRRATRGAIASLAMLCLCPLVTSCGGPESSPAPADAALEPCSGQCGSAGFVIATEQASNTLAKIDVATDTVVARLQVGDGPSAMAVDHQSRILYVTSNRDDAVVAVDPDRMLVAPLSIPGLGRAPIGICLMADRRTLLVTTRGEDGVPSSDDRVDLLTLDNSSWPPTATLAGSVPTGLHPIGCVGDHAGRYAVVTVRNEPAIDVIDLATRAIVARATGLRADAEPEGLDLHPTADVVYVTLHGPASRIEVLDLATLTFQPGVPIKSSPAARPSTGVFTPDGSRFYLSGQTVAQVFMFDSREPLQPVQDMSVALRVGPQPHFIAFLPDGRAYVANTNNGQPRGNLSVIHDFASTPRVDSPILSELAGPLGLEYISAP
ncbi:MAG: YncE family protein [Deltaproteobacteria bacterium]|nr:YncE family protein [Deltaproteobacteria bacterium]